jgi:multiple sugar transport system substrate-binding protein
MRRWIHLRILLCLSGIASAITGCQPQSPPPARSITSIHITGVYLEAARALAGDFERQTGIHVNVVEAGFFSLREKELTDLVTRGGNYDVMQVAYQWDGEILPHLRPLDDVVDQIVPDLTDFIPTVRTNCGQWGGHIYSLPVACDVITLLYRTDIFEARSAEFERLTGRPLQPPTTWPEYLEIARFLNSESLYGNILMGKEQTYTVWSGILHGMGGRQVDERWQPVLNSEAGAQSLALYAEMFKYAPPRSEDRFIEDANALFLQGRGAMYLAWPSLIWSQVSDPSRCKVTGKIGAAVIPGGQPQLSAWSLGVNPACKDLDAACRWIKFFVNQSNSRRLLLLYGKGSPRVSTYSDPQCREKIFYLKPLLDGLAGNQPRFRIPPSQELSDYLDNELIKAIRGQVTPRAALDRTAARWREILIQSGYLQNPPSPL